MELLVTQSWYLDTNQRRRLFIDPWSLEKRRTRFAQPRSLRNFTMHAYRKSSIFAELLAD